MRRLVWSLAAALALSGCATTGYHHEDGAADYYYEQDHGYSGYYAGYGFGGPGYFGFYDPFWAPGFYYGVSAWPYGFGYASYSAGWPYLYSPWYDSWWGVGYNDWSWHHHQQAMARQRMREVQGETAAVATIHRGVASGRDGAAGVDSGPARFARPSDAAPGPRRWNSSDETRQLRTDNVDPYYGVPRVRRGEGVPQRERPQLGVRENPQRALPNRTAPAAAAGGNRPQRAPSAFSTGSMNSPAPARAPAPIRAAPATDRAPNFTPRSMPSSAPTTRGGGAGGRTERR